MNQRDARSLFHLDRPPWRARRWDGARKRERARARNQQVLPNAETCPTQGFPVEAQPKGASHARAVQIVEIGQNPARGVEAPG
jgi:hypothetical protein